MDHITETGTDAVAADLVNPNYMPTNAPTLSLWLKADVGVTTTLGRVSGWTDQSSAGATASVPAVMSGPTVTASWQNGIAGLTFDGATMGMSIPLDLSAYGAVDVYLVLSGSTASLLSMTLEHTVSSVLNAGFGVGMGGNGAGTCVITNGPPSIVDTQYFPCDLSVPRIVSVDINRTATSVTAHVGAAVATVLPVVSGSTSGNYASSTLYIANRAGLVAATCWGGTIGEIIVVGAPAVANTEINMIAYLQRRWGLSS